MLALEKHGEIEQNWRIQQYFDKCLHSKKKKKNKAKARPALPTRVKTSKPTNWLTDAKFDLGFAKVAVVRESHKLFLSLTGEFA
jgi:hypothetical protein